MIFFLLFVSVFITFSECLEAKSISNSATCHQREYSHCVCVEIHRKLKLKETILEVKIGSEKQANRIIFL